MKLVIFARNTTTGAGITGLSPTATLYSIATAAALNPQPTISEIGSGFYAFSVDTTQTGDVCGVIDLTASGPTGPGRYLKVVLSGSNASVGPTISDRTATAAGYALDSTVVHLAGTETITGAKTLTSALIGTNFQGSAFTDVSNTSAYMTTSSASTGFACTNRVNGNTVFKVVASSGQTGDLQEWTANNGTTVYSRVASTGMMCQLTQSTSATPGASPPSSQAGGLIFDTANFKLWAWTGSAWKSVLLS